MAQPDIEVYVKNTPVSTITEWLEQHFDSCSDVTQKGRSYSLTLDHDGSSIPVTIVEDAAGKAWTSVWFNAASTPWESDADCGRTLSNAIKCRVRCNGDFWKDGEENMDEWLEIDEQGKENLINWPG